MQQEADLERRSAKVVEKLPFCCGRQVLSRFDLDKDAVVDDEVYALCAEYRTLVPNGNKDLLADDPSSFDKLLLERFAVHMLEETETKVIVSVEERTDYLVRRFALDQFVTVHTVTT